jgi:oligopeptide transport system substrate-binding protein
MNFPAVLLFFVVLACSACSSKKEDMQGKKSTLTVAVANDPISLDPRLVRDLSSSSVMRLLYEGLLRTNLQGVVAPGIAESYTLSDDKKTYTFHLRQSLWSDGSPLTAEDFEQSWKSVLSPSFPAPNAYQYYLIKGAKAAKEGVISVDEVGIKAKGPSTLIVELEQPALYFIEMVGCHFFFPVHNSTRNQPENDGRIGIVNGPFKLSEWVKRSEMNVDRNANYWDAEKVALERISLQVLDEHTALQLFKAGKMDWVGSPLSTLPQDAIDILKKHNQLQIADAAGTHLFRLNTAKAPFNNEKMRRAFALALNRQEIVDHVTQGNQLPAIALIPPSFGLSHSNLYADHDLIGALALFNEALTEAKLTKSELPSISLSYASNDRNHKIAQTVQQQWNKAFDIEMVLDTAEMHMQLDKIKNGNYQIGLGGWYADIHDPINFLEIFKLADNPTNQTAWHNPDYAALLNASSLESDPARRKLLLAQAERILLEGMPIIPLFHGSYNYLKNDRVHDVYFSPLGYIDFKEARIE